METSPNQKVVALIQARMGSIRLPGKMLMSLHGYPIIEWVLRRIKKSTLIDEVVLCTSREHRDTPLAEMAPKNDVRLFRGDEDDVLGRFYHAALETQATHVIRVCADNPFISPTELDRLVREYFSSSCDYVFNHIPRDNQYPDGFGAEMVSFEILELMHQKAVEPSQREHVMNYIADHPEKFTQHTFDPLDPKLWRPEIRLDIDTLDDFTRLNSLQVNFDSSDVEILKAAEIATPNYPSE